MKALNSSGLAGILFLFALLTGCSQTGLKEVIDLNPEKDLLDLQAQAESAYQKNDMAASEEAYQTLVEEMPEVPLHWFRLANIYVRTNRPVAAINLYREAVLRDPTYSSAWYNMSIVQLKQTAYSLNEMLIYVDENDPMYERASKLLEGIKSIVQE